MYKIKITSYEKDGDGGIKKILSHSFYGKTLVESLEVAKSHLISDYFFSSTFVGKMKWGEGEIFLAWDSKIIGVKQKVVKKVLAELNTDAHGVSKQQKQTKMVNAVIEMTK